MNLDQARNEDLKRAIEALRNGVPNRDAVRFLGCGQNAVEGRFRAQLGNVQLTPQADHQSGGMVIAGGFGTGKSHLLEYLQHIALEQNFVCSRVVISKETPLYEPARIYEAAANTAVAPGLSGHAVQEVAIRLKQDTQPYAEFSRWANAVESGISPIFPATLLLHERLNNDPVTLEQVRGFWAGERLPVATVRSGLKIINQSSTYAVRAVPVKKLALERFRFGARLMGAAGFRGWVILVDEVELIGRYSLLQRAKSYAELARWLGRAEDEQYPGLTVVAAITASFAAEVLNFKGDRDNIGPRLRLRGTPEFNAIAARAETGMLVLENEALSLLPPDGATLDQTYQTLKRIHGDAYAWSPPDVPSAERAIARAMRSYVRHWINGWDLKRLYPGEEVRMEEHETRPDFTENRDLETPVEDDQTDNTPRIE